METIRQFLIWVFTLGPFQIGLAIILLLDFVIAFALIVSPLFGEAELELGYLAHTLFDMALIFIVVGIRTNEKSN